AVIEEPEKVVKRAIQAVKEGVVEAFSGEVVGLGQVHTVCVHGDTPKAVKLAEALRKGLVKAGIEVKPVSQFI
ncbi:MAG: LamB/YcsF family protein, partial [Candidatus Bathyarchaeia archaeon]